MLLTFYLMCETYLNKAYQSNFHEIKNILSYCEVFINLKLNLNNIYDH